MDGDEFDSFCKLNDINIIPTCNLTTKIKGFCYYDGFEYNVFLNLKMDCECQRKTTVHELIHIFNDHFCCDEMERENCEKEVKEIITNLKMFDTEYAYELFTNY
ncbi:MAG: hypothetical protein RR623_09665 [Bacilli bacterium]